MSDNNGSTYIEPKFCPVCSAPSVLKCSKCHSVYYCSRDHQASDWSTHKLDCWPVSVILKGSDHDHEGLLKVLVATRDIKQGEIILKEKPIMRGPSSNMVKPPVDSMNPNRKYGIKNTLCLGCHEDVSNDSVCSKCSWSVCNTKCENNSQHADYECKLFQKYSNLPVTHVTLDEAVINNTCLSVLRCLLLIKIDPERWRKIVEISEKFKNDKSTLCPMGMSYTEAISVVTKFLSKFELGFSASDIETAFDGFYFNRIGSSARKNGIASHIYYKHHLCSQSCLSNATVFMKNRDVCLRANVDIGKGSEITTTIAGTHEGTLYRLEKLKNAIGHGCTCPRCKDPKELGTFLNALKCTKCGDPSEGYLLPKEPLNPDSDWLCINPKCDSQLAKFDIDQILSSVNQKIDLELRDVIKLFEGDHVTRERLVQFVEKMEEKVHRNHYTLFNFKLVLICRIGFYISDFKNPNMIDLIVEWSEEGMALADIFAPGLTRYRGQFMSFGQKGMAFQVYQEISGKNGEDRSPDKIKRLKDKFDKILKLRDEAIIILEIEPEESGEMKMCRDMKEQEDSVEFIEIREFLGLEKIIESLEFKATA